MTICVARGEVEARKSINAIEGCRLKTANKSAAQRNKTARESTRTRATCAEPAEHYRERSRVGDSLWGDRAQFVGGLTVSPAHASNVRDTCHRKRHRSPFLRETSTMPIDSVASHSPGAQLQPHDASHATTSGKQDLLENILQQLDRLLETLMRQLRSASGEHAHGRHGGHHAPNHVSDQQAPQDTSTAGGGNSGNAFAPPAAALPHSSTPSSQGSDSASSTPAAGPCCSK